MQVKTILKKAMIDCDVVGAKALSERAGISYEKTLRLLKGDTSVRLKDAVTVADCLGLKLAFVIKGEE